MKFDKIIEEIFNTKLKRNPKWIKNGSWRFISIFDAPNGLVYEINIEKDINGIMERLEYLLNPSDYTSNPFSTEEGRNIAREIYDYTDPTDEHQGIYQVSFKNLDFHTKQNYNKSSDEWGITNTGSAASVFSIVVELMKDFVKKQNPSILYFTSNEESRTKLYRAILGRLADSLGWKWFEGKDPYSIFVLVRK